MISILYINRKKYEQTCIYFLKLKLFTVPSKFTESNLRNFSESLTFHTCVEANTVCYIAEISLERIIKYYNFFLFLFKVLNVQIIHKQILYFVLTIRLYPNNIYIYYKAHYVIFF